MLDVTPTFDDVEELLIRTENSSETPQDNMVAGGTVESMNSDHYVREVVPVNFGCGLLESESVSSKKRSRVTTEFGISDDVVILGGDQYYYFKLPHKVNCIGVIVSFLDCCRMGLRLVVVIHCQKIIFLEWNQVI